MPCGPTSRSWSCRASTSRSGLSKAVRGGPRSTRRSCWVRASAGAASFRRQKTLEECLVEAEEQVERLSREVDEDPGATSKRQRAAKERAARDRAQRVKEAVKQLPEIETRSPSSPRTSRARETRPLCARGGSAWGPTRAKEIYKERAATVECVNAIARNRGLLRFLVRGLQAAKSVALIYALVHNVARTIALGV